MTAVVRIDRDDADSLRLFAFLWAVAHGYHEAKWSYWLSSPGDFAVGVAVALVLLRPSSPVRLGLLAVVQLVNVAWLMPEVPNHWLIVAFGDLSILAALVYSMRTAAAARIDSASAWRALAPALCALVVVVYGWAAFHKLNAHWFDPSVSCATVLMNDWSRIVPFLPRSTAVDAAMAWLAVAIEAAIPLLLLGRRTRLAGLTLALGFHFALGVPRFFNFSAIMLALFLPFAPPDLAGKFFRWVQDRPVGRGLRRAVDVRALVTADRLVHAGLLIAAAAIFATAPWTYAGLSPVLVREVGSGTRTAWSYAFQALWFPYYLGVCAMFFALCRRTEPDVRTARELLNAPAVVLIVPLVALLNGASPYVGLKTEGVFAMFSNLRTEGRRANHYLVRKTLDLAGLQTDLVGIVSSSDRELQKIADRGLSLTMQQLRHYLARMRSYDPKPIRLEYVRDGNRSVSENALTDRELMLGTGSVVSRLLGFRPVEAEGPVHCRH